MPKLYREGLLFAFIIFNFKSCDNPSPSPNFVLSWAYPCITAQVPSYYEYGLTPDQKILTRIGTYKSTICPTPDNPAVVRIPVYSVPSGTATNSYFYIRACDSSNVCAVSAFAKPQ